MWTNSGVPTGKGSDGHVATSEKRHLLGKAAFLALLVPILLAGCAFSRSDIAKLPVAEEVIRSSVRYQKEYLMVAGDQIEVSVWRTPEVSRTLVIGPDGFISLPLLQRIQAAGLTPSELAERVRQGLSGRFLKPEVTVIPVAVRQPTVYVLGEVRAPGAFPIRTAPNAAQAIALAGGALRTSAENDATIIRLSDDGYLEAIPIVTNSAFSQAGPYLGLAATQLRADDIVFLPESGRSQINRVLSDLLVPLQIYLNYKLINNAF
jgi:protein involved in polysaccharide export with SLBB domain